MKEQTLRQQRQLQEQQTLHETEEIQLKMRQQEEQNGLDLDDLAERELRAAAKTIEVCLSLLFVISVLTLHLPGRSQRTHRSKGCKEATRTQRQQTRRGRGYFRSSYGDCKCHIDTSIICCSRTA